MVTCISFILRIIIFLFFSDALFQDKWWFFGGMDVDKCAIESNFLEKFDLKTYKWSKLETYGNGPPTLQLYFIIIKIKNKNKNKTKIKIKINKNKNKK